MIRFLSLVVASVFALQSATAQSVDLGPGKQPQLAISSGGNILLTFGRADHSICFAQSTDGGKTFAAPIVVAKPKFTPLGMRRGPRIAAVGAGIVIAAVVGETGGGKDGNVVAWRSGDGGKSWRQAPNPLNFADSSAREGLIGIASDGDQRVFVVWLDDRDGGKEIYGALSTNGGESFNDNMPIYRSPDGHVCECCHPSAEFDGKGNLFVMFRNWLDGNRDLYLARSRDDGRSFDGSAVKLGEGSWHLNGCPMDGGGITALDDGRILTAWQRNGEVFTCSPNDRTERSIAAGKQPSIAGSYLVWDDAKMNLMLADVSSDRPPIKLAASAIDPVISLDAKNHRVAIAWESAGHCFVLTEDSPALEGKK